MTHDASLSRLMSLALRHEPGRFGLVLDASGWAGLDDLAAGLSRERADILAAVETSPKQRFELSGDGLRIRALQGHSVSVDLGHPDTAPPDRLFHGTVARFVPSILAKGLVPGKRHDVHLSRTPSDAREVGRRRGEAVVFEVDSEAMARAGHVFRRAPNGVWLIGEVPPQFLRVL